MIYDKLHIMQHANPAVDEVRRAEFFRKGGRMRSMVEALDVSYEGGLTRYLRNWMDQWRWQRLKPLKS